MVNSVAPTRSSSRVPDRSPGGVQSVHRALDLVELVADHGGHLSIAEIADLGGLPLPTIHRLLRTLVDRGWMRQLPNRRYALGFRLMPLGTSAGRLVGANTATVLRGLVEQIGESANLAVLSGDHAEYVAQSPSAHSMRMFTEVGRQVELHSTGVGKAILAQLGDDEALGRVRRVGLNTHTPHTLVTEPDLLEDLAKIRARGYSLDEQEQELGVRCIAVALPTPGGAHAAVSVSGPLTRMTDKLLDDAIPALTRAAEQLATDLTQSTPKGNSR